MTEEAIQEDVSEDKKSLRDEAYEAIVASREAEKNQDRIEEEQKPEVQMVEFTDDDGNSYKVPVTAKFRAKIDGEAIDQTVDNLTRSYQKGASADKRLEEATRKMREAESRAAELAQKETELTQKEQSFSEKMEEIDKRREQGALSDDGYKEAAKKLVEALTESDEEEAVTNLANVLKSLPGRDVDENQLLSKAERRVSAKMEADRAKREAEERKRVESLAQQGREKINDWFREEYKEVVSDRRLMGAAKAELAVIREEHPDWDAQKAAKEAGDRILAWKKPTPPKTPKTASARAFVGGDVKPPTRKDVLNEMRESRGQPLM